MSTAQIHWLTDLGSISMIVAPNLYHHLYLRECIECFPRASVIVPERLQQKIGRIPGAETPVYDEERILFPGVSYFAVSGHFLREIVIFHHASRTLFTADMTYNYHHEQHLAEKIFFRMIGCYGKPSLPFYHYFSIRNRQSIRNLIATVERWQPHRIVMSHGRIIENTHAAHIFKNLWIPFLGTVKVN